TIRSTQITSPPSQGSNARSRDDGAAIADEAARKTSTSKPTGGWPPGVEPGNLYVVSYNYSNVSSPLLVSAVTKEDALLRLNDAWRKSDRYRTISVRFDVLGECKGLGWGALVMHDKADMKYGWSCGFPSPREAILAADKMCAQKRGTNCRVERDGRGWAGSQLSVVIGHSGARPQRPGSFPDWPPPAFQWVAAAATTIQHTRSNSYIASVADAIAQFGKGCGNTFPGVISNTRVSRDIHSCWITFNNTKCLFEVRSSGGLPNQQQCVDTRLTAQGYR
ncbi:MAG: hypothetical protein AB7E73_14270, partial [Burkholderiales bacterium]